MPTLAERINDLLPQTQCTKCGYAGCRPYADAIACGEAPINRCPPGGAPGIVKLAGLLECELLPLDPECGAHRPFEVAVIDEPHCIGCTLCIQACPVDTIVGASRLMHTVLPGWCTGCELCIPPCPVDCIVMVPVQPPREWLPGDAAVARTRYEARQARLAIHPESLRQPENPQDRSAVPAISTSPPPDRQATGMAALARARARRAKGSET